MMKTYAYIVQLWNFGYSSIDSAYTTLNAAKARLCALLDEDRAHEDNVIDVRWNAHIRHKHRTHQMRIMVTDGTKVTDVSFGSVIRIEVQ